MKKKKNSTLRESLCRAIIFQLCFNDIVVHNNTVIFVAIELCQGEGDVQSYEGNDQIYEFWNTFQPEYSLCRVESYRPSSNQSLICGIQAISSREKQDCAHNWDEKGREYCTCCVAALHRLHHISVLNQVGRPHQIGRLRLVKAEESARPAWLYLKDRRKNERSMEDLR